MIAGGALAAAALLFALSSITNETVADKLAKLKTPAAAQWPEQVPPENAVASVYNVQGEALDGNGRVIVTGCLGVREAEIRAAHPDVLERAGANDADIVVALTDSDETNILSTMLAKRCGVGKTLAIINHPDYLDLIQGDAVDIALSPAAFTIGAILTQNTAWCRVVPAIRNLRGAGLLAPDAMDACPAARLAGRIQHRLGPWSERSLRLRPIPRPRQWQFWTGTWMDPTAPLESLRAALAASGTRQSEAAGKFFSATKIRFRST